MTLFKHSKEGMEVQLEIDRKMIEQYTNYTIELWRDNMIMAKNLT